MRKVGKRQRLIAKQLQHAPVSLSCQMELVTLFL